MRRRRPDRARLYRTPSYRALTERLAANVRRLRASAGWTQEAAAERCEISPRMFQAVEAGELNTTLVTLARLAVGFDVDVSQLVSVTRRR